ncbi:MAG TPA: hypothetical protein VF762_06740, partial [Blastocatellia bacterium]
GQPSHVQPDFSFGGWRRVFLDVEPEYVHTSLDYSIAARKDYVEISNDHPMKPPPIAVLFLPARSGPDSGMRGHRSGGPN